MSIKNVRSKSRKINPLLVVRKVSSLRQPTVRAETVENLQKVEMAMSVSLGYQVTKTYFETLLTFIFIGDPIGY